MPTTAKSAATKPITEQVSTATDVSRIVSPFMIVVDTRERRPFAFAELFGDHRQRYSPLQVQLTSHVLAAGDYSIHGYESRIAVERKSKADLYTTLGQQRGRFQRELARLAAYDFAAVVVEATLDDVIDDPPIRSRLNPVTIYRSVVAWQQRHPRVHWWWCRDRWFAERTTYRILERFWKDEMMRVRKTSSGKKDKTAKNETERNAVTE